MFPFLGGIWSCSKINLIFLENPNITFHTNNLVESTNRTLNRKYRGIAHFDYVVYELIEYFKNKNNFNGPIFTLTKVLSLYVRNKAFDNLITKKDLNKSIQYTLKEYYNTNKTNEKVVIELSGDNTNKEDNINTE